MNRTAKQIGYGLFYLAIVALITVSVFSLGEQGAQTNVPGRTAPRALEVYREVTVMTASDGNVAFLGRVKNPNEIYAASEFPYSFRIMRGDVVTAETSRRIGSIYPGETAAFLEILFSPTLTEDTRVVLDVGSPRWTSTEFQVRPTLTVSRVETSSDGLGVFIEGDVQNSGAISVTTANIIAVLKDMNGLPLFAAQTLLDDIPGGTSRPFFVRFPHDQGLVTRAASARTEIILEAR